MRSSSKRVSAIALVAVAAGLSLTACGPDDSSASSSSSSTASGSTVAPGGQNGGQSGSSGSSSSGGADSSNASSSNSGSGSMCQTSNLSISSEHGLSGEGQEIITLKNIGSSTCSMHGFAGVDLRGTGSDKPVSVPRHNGGDVPTVKLAPGQDTQFVLYYPFNNSGGSGYTFTKMTVTPPNETHSKTVSTSINLPLDNPDKPSTSPDSFYILAVGGGK